MSGTPPPVPSKSAFPLQAPFLLDTSALIGGFYDTYPHRVFERLWKDLGELATKGTLLVPRKVRDEIADTNTELVSWLSAYVTKYAPNDAATEAQAAAIITRFPGLILKGKPSPKSDADAWVMAAAIIQKGTVLTAESWRTKPSKISLPAVSEEYERPWCRWHDLFKHLVLHYP
jgi:hypothetical protein